MLCSIEVLTLQQNKAAINVQRRSHHPNAQVPSQASINGAILLICVPESSDSAGTTHALLKAL
jgi:hypothetical protein